jgi:hypothetical protein
MVPVTLVTGYFGAALTGAGHGDYTILAVAGAMAFANVCLFLVAFALFSDGH